MFMHTIEAVTYSDVRTNPHLWKKIKLKSAAMISLFYLKKNINKESLIY